MSDSLVININQLVLILIDAMGIMFALWVYFTNKQDTVNRWFSSMVITILLWITFYHIASLPAQRTLSLMFFKAAAASVFIFFVAYYFFIVRWFLDKKGFFKPLGIIILVYGFLFSFIAVFSDFVVKSLSFKNGVPIPMFPFWGWLAFYGYVVVLTIIVNVVLIQSYFKSSERKKLKIQYFLIGILLFAGLNTIFNVILPVSFKEYRFYSIGNYSAILLIGFSAYAIVKQKLFGIKVVLTRLFVGLAAVLLLVDLLTAKSIFEYIWKGALFVGFIAFGWFLVKSVVREIEQKERIDKFAKDLKVANVSLELANKKLKKLDKAKSEFISIASHQLRTPLTAIKGYVSMILEGDYGRLPKETLTPLTNVYESNQRLVKLVNSLLNLSRLEAGRIVIQKANFSVQDLIAELVRSFVVQLQGKDVKLKFKKPRVAIPDVFADRAKIAEVISNLFDNAIKYTPKGSISATLEYKKSINKVLITVSDTGAGMTKEEMTKLFKTFSRAGAGNKFWTEGTGLGLYVARKFVEMHRGRIWAESKGKEKGSKFLIELPVK